MVFAVHVLKYHSLLGSSLHACAITLSSFLHRNIYFHNYLALAWLSQWKWFVLEITTFSCHPVGFFFCPSIVCPVQLWATVQMKFAKFAFQFFCSKWPSRVLTKENGNLLIKVLFKPNRNQFLTFLLYLIKIGQKPQSVLACDWLNLLACS